MKVGDLVQQVKEDDWVGIITGFRRGPAFNPGKDYLYAVVMWNNTYPAEEEYLQHIEVISETR